MTRRTMLGAAACTALAQEPKELNLFLLAGQSNMAGRGEVEAQDREPIPDVLALNKFRRNLDSPRIRERLVQDPVSRSVVLRLDYKFGTTGSRPGREPGFEYEGGGGGGAAPTGP